MENDVGNLKKKAWPDQNCGLSASLQKWEEESEGQPQRAGRQGILQLGFVPRWWKYLRCCGFYVMLLGQAGAAVTSMESCSFIVHRSSGLLAATAR